MNAIELAERRLLPDSILRIGMRRLMRERLKEVGADAKDSLSKHLKSFAAKMCCGPIAPVPERANEQHYEVPAYFYTYCLGPHKKYSCCYYPTGTESLEEAESLALELVCERAQIKDGMTILELGCGWGSLTLWLARHYPNSKILAVSNSNSQREYIEGECFLRGLTNVQVRTCDMNEFRPDQRFDRVVSIEMFEHMRNWAALFQRISSWLEPGGLLFLHVFCHRHVAYAFESEGSKNWMGRNFFSGGIMPAEDLPAQFQEHLMLENQWYLNGTHYQKTAEDWLRNLDSNREAVLEVLGECYGPDNAKRWLQKWRMFYMACAELFGYNKGNEWGVGHYVMRPRTGKSNN